MRSALVLLGALLLTSCGFEEDRQSNTSTETIDESSPVSVEVNVVTSEIEWYDGTIDAAFAHAEAQSQPIFLYWGAVWCPPCQEIKHTVFKSQAFIELSDLFVPVYLDGDTDRAQVWGESFGVKGYPTMIVFNPDGLELTRIPGGIDIERYNSVLALALNEMRPTSDLVALALNAPGQLRSQDFQQLAYYSWGQDSTAIPVGTDHVSLFRQLTHAAPEGPLKARFLMNTLSALAAKQDAALSQEDTRMLSDILRSEELTLACWDTLAYRMTDFLPMIDALQRDDLAASWTSQLLSLRTHASLSRAEGLAGWLPTLEAVDGDLTDEMKSMLIQELNAAEMATTDQYERQSVVYQISEIYRAAQLNTQARTLLLAELDRSASPYYFMSSLAAMAEEAGDHASALSWRGTAWDAASGEATRFQWGASYLRALIRLAPEQAEDIRTTTDTLLAEVSSTEVLFAGRNYRRLQGLSEAIAQWEQDTSPPGVSFSASVKALCALQREGSSAQRQCLQLTNDNVLARTL